MLLTHHRVLLTHHQVLLTHHQMLRLLKLPDLSRPEELRGRAFLELAYASGMQGGELANLDL